MTASPRAVLGEPLDELERLAREVIEASMAHAALGPTTTPTQRTLARRRVRRALDLLASECTPATVLSLVALARAGMEDSECLRWIEENAGHELRIDRDGDDIEVRRWYRKYISYQHWFGRDIRSALRAARAPAGPGGENA